MTRPSKIPPEFQERILKYFNNKQLQVSFNYWEVWAEEHLRAFTVAGILEEDILADFEEAIKKAAATGQSFLNFQKDIRKTATDLGWWGRKDATGDLVVHPHRLRTVFDTNLRMARATGQWNRIEKGKDIFPYLQYNLGPSNKHRPDHEEWEGYIRHVDDPWWDTHMPPNGYGCKCYVEPLTRKKAEALGGITRLSSQDKKRIEGTPYGIDPGFAYNPGKVSIETQLGI